jgi:phosphoglycerate kinase
MPKLTLSHLEVKNKKVLMRVDFNVPLSKKGEITEDTRIRASLSSIQYVLDHGGSLILMSHLGRPNGKIAPEFSLAPCAKRLSELLKKPVLMAPDCIGPAVKQMVDNLKPGQVLLLENLRFHPGEEHPEKEPSFVKQLAELGDLYVNDAFGTAHRSHASTALIANYFPGKAAAGFLMEKEINFLGSALINPKRPFYALIGGAKISSKIGVLKALINKVDGLLIGGGMAYTFYKAQGIPIGNSIHEDNYLKEAKEVIDLCRKRGIKFQLPLDNVSVESIDASSEIKIVESGKGIPNGFQGVDIGPKTVQAFSTLLKEASTIFWNGPLGVFETSRFAVGTKTIAEVIGSLKAITIVGGGDSIAALQAAGVADKMTHLSTGGGASLEFIEHGTLPGINALTEAV